ncbi:MAG: M56 family metallopeptidase [Solirubrobacteraceae bacterium]
MVLSAALAASLAALPVLVGTCRRAPATALAMWSLALAVRAGAVLVAVSYVLLVFPGTRAFAAITDWCVHTAIPLVSTRVDLAGHRIGDLTVGLPLAALVAVVTWALVGSIRGARALRRTIGWEAVGEGPSGTVVLRGRDVFLAAAGFRKPRIVVTAGALVHLDDQELAAAIAHERGHIRRGHRYLLLFAELNAAVARQIPGTRMALAHVRLHAERDADAWALRNAHDRFALASAICKAALSRTTPPAATALGGAGGTEQRIDELIAPAPATALLTDRALLVISVSGAIAMMASLATLAPAFVAEGGPHVGAAVRLACSI